MSQRLRNPYDLGGNDIVLDYQSPLVHHRPTDTNSDVLSSTYYDNNSIRGAYNIPSKSPRKNAADIAIFGDENYEMRNMYESSRNFNPELYVKALSASIGSSNAIPSSTALQALQDYGPTMASPIQSPAGNDWNLDYHHASRKNIRDVDFSSNKMTAYSDMLRSETFLKQKHGNEIPKRSTTDSKSSKTFSDLNLNSIDEEDEFLYGDSSSLPEEPKSVKSELVEANIKSTNSEWSDEEDILCESSKTFHSHIKSNFPKKSSVWDLRNDNMEASKARSKSGEEKQSSIVSKKMAVENLSDYQKQLSPIQNSRARKIENAKLSPVDKNSCELEKSMAHNKQLSGTKSKYHVAAQILKKSSEISYKISGASEIALNVNQSSSGKLEPEIIRHVSRVEDSNKISNKRTAHKDLRKSSQIEKVQLKSSNKISSSLKDPRRPRKALNQKGLDSIRDYLRTSPRKRSHSQGEHSYELKRTTHENLKEISPISPYGSPRNRSPDSSHRSPYHSRQKSPISKSRCRSPSYGSRNRSPVTTYEKHHSYENSPRSYSYERYSRYSRSPIRKSQEKSPEYYRYRNRSPRSSRSPERSRSPTYHRSRDKRGEDKYKRDSYREKSTSYKHHARSPERRYQRKERKLHDSSDESFCTVSYESRSVSSSSGSDGNPVETGKKCKASKKLKEKKPKHDRKFEKNIGENKSVVKSSDVVTSKLDESCQNISENLSTENKHSEKDVNTYRDNFLKNLNPEDEKYLIKIVQDNPDVFQNIFPDARDEQPLSNTSATFTDSSATFTNSSTSFTNITDTYNMLTTTPLQEHIHLSHPELYAYNSSIHLMPVPFPPPPVNNFTPLMPSTEFPSPSVAAPLAESSVEYKSFPNFNIPPVDPRPVKKPSKKRPTTLTAIPVSDDISSAINVTAIPAPDDIFSARNVTAIPVSDDIFSARNVTAVPVSDDISSARNVTGQQISVMCSASKSVESLMDLKRAKFGKVTTQKNLIEVSVNSVESNIEDNASLLLGKYKKLKAKRHSAHSKVNSSVNDVDQMCKKIEEVWGKKTVSATERFFHSKCKNILSSCLDSMNYYVREAKQLDEELAKFKSKLPKELLPELSKIKIENCIKETDGQSVLYAGVDGGKQHACYSCNKQFSTVLSMLNHLHTSEHKEHINPVENDWMKHFKKELMSEDLKKEGAKKIFVPVKGVEFVKSFSGYFCTLCTETSPDVTTAERHLMGHEHSLKYKNYIKDNPLYEKKCLFKTYVNYSASAKEKRKRDDEKKEPYFIKRKKVEETDGKVKEILNEKVKEMLNEQKSKEKKVEELEETDMEASGSKNQRTANIKLTLSSEKEKKNENTMSANEPKATPKFVYIGKAPNFKTRPKPWYKREIYAEKNEDSGESVGADTLKITTIKNKDAVPKLNHSSSKNESDTSKNIASLNSDTSELEKIVPQKISSKKELAHTYSIKEDHTLSKDNAMIKSSKRVKVKDVAVKLDSSDIKITESNEQPKQYKIRKTISKETTASEIKDPIVNQAIKNILYGNDSSLHQKDIPVSEIKLPKSPDNSSKLCPEGKSKHFSLERKKNKHVPMDISPVRNSGNISLFDPNRKTYTEEEKDFLILGINKDDFRPLAIPVPPPPSVLGFYNVAGNATIDTTVPPPTAVDTSVPPPGLATNKIDISVPPPILTLNKIDISVPPPVLPLNTIDISVPPPIAINTTVPPPVFPLNVNQSSNFRLPSQTGFSSPGFPRPIINKKANLSNQTRLVFEQNSQSNLITIKPSKEISDLSIRNVSFTNIQTGTNLCNEESGILTEKVKKVSEELTIDQSVKSKKENEISFTKSSVNTKNADTDKSIENKILKREQGMLDNSSEKDTAPNIEGSKLIEVKLSTDELKGSENIKVIDEKSEANAIEGCINDLKCSVADECENARQSVGLIVNETTDVTTKSIVNEINDQSVGKYINVLKVEKHDSVKLKPLEITSTGNIETDGSSNMHKAKSTNSNELVVQSQKTFDNREYSFNVTDNTVVTKTLIYEQNVLVNNKSDNTKVVSSPLNNMDEFELKEDNIIPEVSRSAEFTESTNQIPCEKDDVNKLKSTSMQSPITYEVQEKNLLKLKYCDNQESNNFDITEPSSNDHCLNSDPLSSKSQIYPVSNTTVYETEFKLESASENCNESQSLSFMLERTDGSISDQRMDINSNTDEETSMTKDSVVCGEPPVLDLCLEEELSESLHKSEQSSNDSILSLNAKLGISGMKSKAELEINNKLSSGNSKFLISDKSRKEVSSTVNKSEILKFVDKNINSEISNIADVLCIESAEVSKSDVSESSIVIETQELKPVQSTISEFCEENNKIAKLLFDTQASSNLKCSEEILNATMEIEHESPDFSSAGIGSSLDHSDVCSVASTSSAYFEKMDIDILCQQNSVASSGSVASQKSEDQKDISEINIKPISQDPEATGDKALSGIGIESESQVSESKENTEPDTDLNPEFQEPEVNGDKMIPEILTNSRSQECEENTKPDTSLNPVSQEPKNTNDETSPQIGAGLQEPEDSTEPDTSLKPEFQESEDGKDIEINMSQELKNTNDETLPQIDAGLREPEDSTEPDTSLKPESQESEDEKDISEINIKPVLQEPETTDDKTKPDIVTKTGSQGSEDNTKPDASLNPEFQETDQRTSLEITKSLGFQGEAIKSTEILSETSKQPENAVLLKIDDSDTDEYENEEQ